VSETPEDPFAGDVLSRGQLLYFQLCELDTASEVIHALSVLDRDDLEAIVLRFVQGLAKHERSRHDWHHWLADADAYA
jgi:hypothetical protein